MASVTQRRRFQKKNYLKTKMSKNDIHILVHNVTLYSTVIYLYTNKIRNRSYYCNENKKN